MYTMIFGFIWGLITAALGVGWFDGDIATAIVANVVPITAVGMATRFA